MHRADAQTLDRDRRQPVGRVRSNEPARHLATDGDERGDALPLEPCEGEPDGTERGGIEPLDVVDRETERVGRSEGSQRREERSRDGSFVGLPFRVAEQQRVLECPALDRGEERSTSSATSTRRSANPAYERRVSDSAGLLVGTRYPAAVACSTPREPDHGLPDPRLAVERDRRGKPFRIVEQGGDGRGLVRPTDQRREVTAAPSARLREDVVRAPSWANADLR